VFPSRRAYTVPLASHPDLRLGDRCLVMGILNVTPDSLAEARSGDVQEAIAWALHMEAQGADIIDIGGESTRPGADPVPAEEELARVLPVLRGLAGRLRVPISIDTYKAMVAAAAIEAGAAMINDVSGLQYDADLARVAATAGCGLILTHTRGRSKSMYAEADYSDLVGEIVSEISQSIDRATARGVARDQIIVDPGIGFAKRPAHSYGVLARLPEIAGAFDRPLLAGPSRKSFMSAAVGDRPAHERDWGTAAAVTAAVLGGAHVVRVHAVGEMAQVVRVAEAIRAAGAPHGAEGREQRAR
jgi:dihydropteroate synthase